MDPRPAVWKQSALLVIVGVACGIAIGALITRSRHSAAPPPANPEGSEPAVPLVNAPAASELEKTLSQLTAPLSPDDWKAIQAAQRLMSAIAPKTLAYEKALGELRQAGLVQPDTIKSKEDIDARAQLVRNFKAATDPLVDCYKNFESNYRRELEKLKYPENLRDSVMSDFRKSAQIELNATIRQYDAEMATNMLSTLELLSREWGAWRVDAEGKVAFTNPAAAQEYGRLAAQLAETADRQSAAQADLAKKLEANPGKK